MAAQPWKIYSKAKKKIGNGTISLAGAFRMQLYQSASNAAALTQSLLGSLTSEVASVASSYSLKGKTLTSILWTVGASAKQYMFRTGNVFWSANTQISNFKFAVIYVSAATTTGKHVVAVCSLTSSQTNLAAGNRLTVAPNSSGVFTLQ